MHVLTLRAELHIPASQSLKAKRSVVQSIVRSLDGWNNVGAAEVDHQELWQRTAIGVTVVGPSASRVVDLMDGVERFLWSQAEAEVIEADRRWQEW